MLGGYPLSTNESWCLHSVGSPDLEGELGTSQDTLPATRFVRRLRKATLDRVDDLSDCVLGTVRFRLDRIRVGTEDPGGSGRALRDRFQEIVLVPAGRPRAPGTLSGPVLAFSQPWVVGDVAVGMTAAAQAAPAEGAARRRRSRRQCECAEP
jgi:hypothetical protein